MRMAWVSVAVAGCHASPAKSDSDGRPAIADDLTQFVEPHIGTGGSGWLEGDTFAGAAFPLGMVQLSPDTLSNPAGGYDYADTIIKEFSLTHFSGRGCEVYQDIPLMPFVGKVTMSPATSGATYRSAFSHDNEVATAGYYKVFLDRLHSAAQLGWLMGSSPARRIPGAPVSVTCRHPIDATAPFDEPTLSRAHPNQASGHGTLNQCGELFSNSGCWSGQRCSTARPTRPPAETTR
jgi:hypothetical protein